VVPLHPVGKIAHEKAIRQQEAHFQKAGDALPGSSLAQAAITRRCLSPQEFQANQPLLRWPPC